VRGWSTQFIANPRCWPQRPCPKPGYISAIFPRILRSHFLHCVCLQLGALLVPKTALSHCSTMAHTKTHCNTLQRERLRAALALQYTSTHCNAPLCNKKLAKMMAEMEFCHGWAPWPAARASHTQAGWVPDQRGWSDAFATKQPWIRHELAWILIFFCADWRDTIIWVRHRKLNDYDVRGPQCRTVRGVKLACSVLDDDNDCFITFNSSLVPLIEGLCTSNPWEFEFSGFRRNQTVTHNLGIDSPSLWPEPRLHVRSKFGSVQFEASSGFMSVLFVTVCFTGSTRVTETTKMTQPACFYAHTHESSTQPASVVPINH